MVLINLKQRKTKHQKFQQVELNHTLLLQQYHDVSGPLPTPQQKQLRTSAQEEETCKVWVVLCADKSK